MRFTKCKCGNDNFEMTRNGKMECTKCGKWFNPFSSIHHKVIKENGKHYFWVIVTPHFLERMEQKLPVVELEELYSDCLKIEKQATMKKTQGTKWKGFHIYWKYKFNPKRKRLEMELISLTDQKYFTTKFHRDVEFVEVEFK